MKKLNLRLQGHEMLSKEQMKRIIGGTEKVCSIDQPCVLIYQNERLEVFMLPGHCQNQAVSGCACYADNGSGMGAYMPDCFHDGGVE